MSEIKSATRDLNESYSCTETTVSHTINNLPSDHEPSHLLYGMDLKTVKRMKHHGCHKIQKCS